MSASPFAFTLAKSADPGKRAAKKIVGKRDGSRETFAYDRVQHWLFRPAEIGNPDRLAAFLRQLAARPDLMLVMGAPRQGLDLSQPQLRRWADPDPTRNTLVDVPRAWVAIDVDGYRVPDGWGLAERLADAAAAIRDDALGDGFAGAACVAAATASTGLVGADTAKCRLFFSLNRPHPIADLYRWARGAQIAGLPVDPSVMQAGQPIYTARPLFAGALTGPVPPALRAIALPGRGDGIALDLNRYDAPAAEAERRTLASEHACGGDWRRLLADALGGSASFFAPLTCALGLAARTGAAEAEIIAFAQQLLAERADPSRLRQYGPRWCAATIRRFRDRDRAVEDDIGRLRTRIFGEHAG